MPLPSPDTGRQLATRLLRWFEKNGRDYPWRRTRNAFHVLSAELMLQRTRADQVEPVWVEFSARFGSPNELLEAGRDAVNGLYSRLGLHWRAAQFWGLCRELVVRYGGEVPSDRERLMRLPGVGQYAAGMTLTTAFRRPTGVADSNILRVYGRYFDLQFSDADRRKKAVLAWAQSLLPSEPDDASRYLLALVDLGALICTPRHPGCNRCPLRHDCAYALRNA
ncbi:MAG: hypothetical protein WBW88_15385 [Rhodothermales bacterium]